MMKNSRIMILSSQEAVCIEMAEYFRESQYNVMWVTSYDDLLTLIADGKHQPDILLFDIPDPSRREYEIIRRVQEFPAVRTLILSEDGRLDGQLYMYSIGIDDYMVKPAPLPLVEAHIEAILRRYARRDSVTKTMGDLTLDYEGRRVFLEGEPMSLTSREYDLMNYFMEHSGMVLSRDKILDSVWGYDYVGGYRSVDTLVKKLRAKLGKKHPYIRTVYGVGYCFDL